MITIYDDASLAGARAEILNAELAAQINRITQQAKSKHLWDWTCILVIDDEDTADDIRRVLGYDPLLGPLHDGAGPFIPYWSWLELHGGLYSMLLPAGTDFAWFILVPDEGADGSGLAALCREHAAKPDI